MPGLGRIGITLRGPEAAAIAERQATCREQRRLKRHFRAKDYDARIRFQLACCFRQQIVSSQPAMENAVAGDLRRLGFGAVSSQYAQTCADLRQRSRCGCAAERICEEGSSRPWRRADHFGLLDRDRVGGALHPASDDLAPPVTWRVAPIWPARVHLDLRRSHGGAVKDSKPSGRLHRICRPPATWSAIGEARNG